MRPSRKVHTLPQQEQQDQSWSKQIEQSFNLLQWIIAILCMVVLPFTRHSWGVKAFGTEAMLAFCLIPLYGAVYNDPYIIQFWYAWICMVVWCRITATREHHRFFMGYARFWGNFLHWKKAEVLEAITVCIIGQCFYQLSDGMGQLIGFWCPIALSIELFMNISINNSRKLAIQDAQREAEAMQRDMEGH